MLNEGLIRLKYGDKSGLYELEFEYLRDEKTYDDYLAMGQIQWASMDSINHLEVTNVIFNPDSSADVEILYVFDSEKGGFTDHTDNFVIYRRNGRWIKPTVSIL